MTYPETERVEIPHILGDDVLKNLRYNASAQIVAPWQIDEHILAARLLTAEPRLVALLILFVGMGVLGYLLCRFRWSMVAPFIAFLALYIIWWLRELHWPKSGPRLAPYANAFWCTLFPPVLTNSACQHSSQNFPDGIFKDV